MRPNELHRDRGRAESFGAIAADYEQWRPGYPDTLFDELAALAPHEVLDVGCGTGKAAEGLVRRGLSVLGVEPDEQMARIARERGVPVEIASFERWDAAGRRFDLVTCGSAWHWIDPERGTDKVAAVLAPGGTLARFWSHYELDADTVARFEAIYQRHAPTAHCHGRPTDTRVSAAWSDPVAAHPAFTAVEHRALRRDRTFTTDEWLGMIVTFSDHQRLDPATRAPLLAALRAELDAHGGAVDARATVLLVLARRT